MKGTLHLCGAGNPEGVRLALRLNELRPRWTRIVLLDDDPARQGECRLGVPVVGGFDALAGADPGDAEVVNLVSRTTAGRRAAARRIAAHGVPWTGLVSPDVDLLGAEVASDLIAYQNATIGPEVTVGEGSVVFMGAAVGHECTVGRNCVIAANAVLNARVRLSDGVYVGTNATVLPEIVVGAGAIIGAGAVVIDDIPPGATVVGPTCEIMQAGIEEPAPLRGDSQDTERSLAALWCEVMGLTQVEPDQNFFELGGTSLLALRLASRIESVFGRPLSPVEVFRSPTVRSLARRLASPGEGARVPDPATLRAAARRGAIGLS